MINLYSSRFVTIFCVFLKLLALDFSLSNPVNTLTRREQYLKVLKENRLLAHRCCNITSQKLNCDLKLCLRCRCKRSCIFKTLKFQNSTSSISSSANQLVKAKSQLKVNTDKKISLVKRDTDMYMPNIEQTYYDYDDYSYDEDKSELSDDEAVEPADEASQFLSELFAMFKNEETGHNQSATMIRSFFNQGFIKFRLSLYTYLLIYYLFLYFC